MKLFLVALAFTVFAVAQAPTKIPVKLFIEAREKGTRNVTLELTRDLMKACPSEVSITENANTAELRLAITPGASTLYKAGDGNVEHIFSARFTVSGLSKEVCSYLRKR